MKYQILLSDNQIDLAEIVDQAMSDGWAPHGGVSMVALPALPGVDEIGILLGQAMVKISEASNDG